MPWAKAAVPAPASPASADDDPVQPAASDAQAQEAHDQGETVTEEERENQASPGRAQAQRMNELMRNHTKAELLHMAYVGGLVNHNSPRSGARTKSLPLSSTSSSGPPPGPLRPGPPQSPHVW